MMSEKQSYRVIDDVAVIERRHYKRGDVVQLHPRQAKYLLAPHAGKIEPVSATSTARKAPAAKPARVSDASKSDD
jgi:hypothetical protein